MDTIYIIVRGDRAPGGTQYVMGAYGTLDEAGNALRDDYDEILVCPISKDRCMPPIITVTKNDLQNRPLMG